MNRGKYDFPTEAERDAWYKFISTMLREPALDTFDFSNHDISPVLLNECVEAADWCWEATSTERNDSWSYYTHMDYPNKYICIYADGNTFKLTMSMHDKEEDKCFG